MKKLFVLFLISLPMAVNASILTFECKSPEIAGVHKFDAKGIVTVDEYNKAEGVISIQTQKAQAEGSIQIFEEIKITGVRQHFGAGEMTSNPFDQFTFFTTESYIKSLNLLVDFKVEIASQILSVDNFVYKSNCYAVETSSSQDKQ